MLDNKSVLSCVLQPLIWSEHFHINILTRTLKYLGMNREFFLFKEFSTILKATRAVWPRPPQ